MIPGLPSFLIDRVREAKQAVLWAVYVRRGCLLCGQTFAWCPDCHTCLHCGRGCDECKPWRRNRGDLSHKPTEPRR